MRDTARKELAYVALESIFFVPKFLSPVLENQTTYSDNLKIRIQNYGRTPARETIILCSSSVTKRDEAKPVSFEAEGPFVGRQMLHPGMTFSVLVIFPKHTEAFWIWGHIVYQDIYDRWWRTNFHYAHHPKNIFTPERGHNNERGPYKTHKEARASVEI